MQPHSSDSTCRRVAVLGPWLFEEDIALIHADAGVGKTQFALTLALLVASGTEAFGFKGIGAPVLYVDGEMSRYDLHARLSFLAATLGVDASGMSRFHLLARSLTPNEHFESFPNVSEPDGRESVTRFADMLGAQLVVLDNYRTLANIEDENDAAAFGSINTWLKRLARDRAVIGVHHNNKSGSTFGANSRNYSGSTAIETPLSVRLNLLASTPSQPNNAAFVLKVGKNRSAVRDSLT